MRERATVRKVTGNCMQLQGVRLGDALGVTAIPDPASVEIVEQDGAVYLLYLDQSGECIADTWHETVEAAKTQANFEFGVEDSDWRNVEAYRH